MKRIGLKNLEEARKRGDLIQLLKFQKGLDFIDEHCLPRPTPSCLELGPAGATRGNSARLERQALKSMLRNDFASFTTIRDNFFSNRIMGAWKELPESIISSSSLHNFKVGMGKREKFSNRF